MAEKTEEQKKQDAAKQEAARKKSLDNLGKIVSFPGRAMEAGYGAVVEGIFGFGDQLAREAVYRELKAAEYEYNANPSEKNKKRLESAKQDLQELENTQEKTSTASAPQGKGKTERFSLGVSGVAGADNPAERAKTEATGKAPEQIAINPLDNARWNSNSFLMTSEDPFSYYYSTGTSQTELPIAFIANETGSIYQEDNGSGNPADLETSVNRIIKDYSSSGRMNELRDLLITSKIAASPAEQAAMGNAKNMQNAAYFGQDVYTRDLVKRAVQFLTISNIAAAGVPNNKPQFESIDKYLKGYKGELNYLLNQNGSNGYGGGGTPRRTVTLSKQVFTPEDLELNIDAFFQEYTGQGASKEDIDYLVKKFNKQATEKTVNVRSGNTVTSTTTGGLSQAEQQLAMREMALQDPAAESYNKATTYLNYFREALASPIELG